MNTAKFFDTYYRHALTNSILIMDCDGTVLDINQAFTYNFGYTNRDLRGKNFSLLFSKRDNEKGRPQLELDIALRTGQAQDENYLLDKDGQPIWCVGECLLVDGEGPGEKYIVKDVVNLQAKYHLQSLLREAEELLESIFNAPKSMAMMILDGSMKVQTVNEAFLLLFTMTKQPLTGSTLAELAHPFWQQPAIKEALRKAIVVYEPINDLVLLLNAPPGENKRLRLTSKTIDKPYGEGKKVFVLIYEMPDRAA